jgi:hypothetical protein
MEKKKEEEDGVSAGWRGAACGVSLGRWVGWRGERRMLDDSEG